MSVHCDGVAGPAEPGAIGSSRDAAGAWPINSTKFANHFGNYADWQVSPCNVNTSIVNHCK
jgi:hypothetical protein